MSNWLAKRIAAHGPMTVDAFMRACLTDPVHGYYRCNQAIGVAGDFITAPEISQIFGELIGIWVAASWQALGEPKAWRLIELGPGRGTLMSDLLRALKVLPAARAGVRVELVEVNERLRVEQAAKLAGCGVPVAWMEAVRQSLEAMPAIVIANEFLDALPIRQLVAQNGQWRERVVAISAQTRHPREGGGSDKPDAAEPPQHIALPTDPISPVESAILAEGWLDPRLRGGDESGLALSFGFSGSPYDGPYGAAQADRDGSICELMSGAQSYLAELAKALAAAPQVHLYVDYGHVGPVVGNTLQAVSAHRYADPLAAPGEHDLSAQVDFAQIGAIATQAGLTAHGPLTQAEFLGRLGAAERLQRLAMRKDARTLHQLQTGLTRLMDPSGMGGRFKAMAFSSPGLAVPPVF